MSATAVSAIAAEAAALEVKASVGAGAFVGAETVDEVAAASAPPVAATAAAPAPDPAGALGAPVPVTGAPPSGRMRMRRTPTAPAAAAAPTRTTPPTIAAVVLPDVDDPPVAPVDAAADPDGAAEEPPVGASEELADGLGTAEPLPLGAAEPLPPGAAEPPLVAVAAGVPEAETSGTAPPVLVLEGFGHGLGLGLGLGLAVAYWAHSSSMVHSCAPSPPPADWEAMATVGTATTLAEMTANAASAKSLVPLLARIGDGRELAQLPREVCADLIDGHKVGAADRVCLGGFR